MRERKGQKVGFGLTAQVDGPENVQAFCLPLKWSSQKDKSPATQGVSEQLCFRAKHKAY